ncbi:hypothetical protein [Streptomyces sp. NPDC048057]|uniref:hypothetical protein n=1 Tax=Streptomyces sp. NPDC048057 TaxID=3155628 RepID=UPI0033C99B98
MCTSVFDAESTVKRRHGGVHPLDRRAGVDFDGASRTPDLIVHRQISAPRNAGLPGIGPERNTDRVPALLHGSPLKHFLSCRTNRPDADLPVIQEVLLCPDFEMAANRAYTAVVRVPKGGCAISNKLWLEGGCAGPDEAGEVRATASTRPQP